MKIMHLADLHIGKNVDGYSMIEDQIYALKEIVNLLEKEEVDVLLIAGDIYQNSVPSAEAIKVFDDFITSVKRLNIKILIISGNHDSSERLAFASDILSSADIYISRPYNREIQKVTFSDKYGKINFYLFPYVKPIHVKQFYPEEKIEDYSDAVRIVLENVEINRNERNVILSHQFILNAKLSESEEIYAGLLEAVPDYYYEKFDYIAMGHIHKKQSFLNGKLRYPGSLLKYSASETGYDKSITLVDFKEKGNIEIYEKKINYLRDMRTIKGKFEEIIKNSINDRNKDDYIHLVLEDEDDILDGMQKIRKIYPNTLTMKYINKTYGNDDFDSLQKTIKNKNPLEIFEEFYQQRTGKDLSDDKKKIMKDIIEKIWSDNENN
ncbi:exonuclease SbcCD subunit D [Helcococcus ovis]|uniref:Nuclease SbcCD subunit D n=1 Tax=Helcococcus ovis TaxID=72026 RepID=A0A4R9C2N9_9FIRM|nr:exonuclease SbcCD subunit D [Helcococcus ovis]TFF64836.1 exonuclease SbcCD subunit D [Helcococcus ovis]TFF65844.1 exonuclease SbcCD subunit D [Helcococcus ovis]TFF67820.1 exonuclease SbcCD subunit D [Helcococcus ovis]WNZ01085.1 exonuclease SbcCD subunit D [Helcococcus ovis]